MGGGGERVGHAGGLAGGWDGECEFSGAGGGDAGFEYDGCDEGVGAGVMGFWMVEWIEGGWKFDVML